MIADDTAAIKARMEEIRAERNLALTGSSAPVTGQEPKTEQYHAPYGYGGLIAGGCNGAWKWDDYSQGWVKAT